jgi:hypothetical protein
MYILISLLTLTIGAILDRAVVVSPDASFNWNKSGAVLVAVGFIGLLISIVAELINYKDRQHSDHSES